MSKKLFGKFFIFLLVVGLLFAVAPTGQALAQTVPPTKLNMSLPTAATTDSCTGIYEAYVNVVDVTDLAAYTLNLTYDADLITVTKVENVGFVGGTAEPLDTFAGGNIKFGWSVLGGAGEPVTITGDKSLIKITFQSKGLAGAAAFAIDAANSMLVHWDDVQPIPFEVTGGATVNFGSVVTNTTAEPDKAYCNLAVAVAEATTGDTLRADVDFTVPKGIAVQKALTLNTNGKTITYSSPNSAMLMVSGAGDLIVTGSGVLDAPDATPLSLLSFNPAITPKITLADATISGGFRSVSIQGAMYPNATPSPVLFTMTGGTTTNGIFIQSLGAELIVSGGTVTCTGDEYACPAPIYGSPSQYSEGTKVTISGTANVISPANIGPAIYQRQDGELFVTGGTISGLNGINMEAGDLTVSGTPTITGTGGDAILMNGNIEPYYPSDLTANISGGIITSTGGYALHETALVTTRTSEIAVSGGKFTGSLGAVQFTTVDPFILKLTDGAYNTDPGATPDYVFEPLDTYQSTGDNYYYIDTIISGTIAAHEWLTGIATQVGDTVNFLGVIPWYPEDLALDRVQGNRVGVIITEPTGVDLSGATIEIVANEAPYYSNTWALAKDHLTDNYVPYWPLVDAIFPDVFTITVQWNPVSEQVFTVNVLEGSTLQAPPAPVITSDDIQGYYLVGDTQEFHVSMTNPADGAHYDSVMFKVTIPNATLADITTAQFYETGWPLPEAWYNLPLKEVANGSGGTDLVGWYGGIFYGGFPLDNDGVTHTEKLRVNFAADGIYGIKLELYTMTGVDLGTPYDYSGEAQAKITEKTFAMDVYDKPVITATFPAGPYVAGEPVTVPISITNPGGIPGPFSLVLDLPDGTVFTFNGEEYLCGDDPDTTEVEVGCPAIPITSLPIDPASNLVITFDEGWSGDIGMSLYDTSWVPDRKLATFTKVDVVVYGNVALVTGTISMQGRLTTADVPVTLTGTLGFGPVTETSLAGASLNLTFTNLAVDTYTITTDQPRYLNITAAMAKTIDISTDIEIAALRLRGGNAIYTDNIINDLDLGKITSGYSNFADHPDADVNFDNKVNIQDLALVGGNYNLTSAAAYAGWQP